MVLCTLNARELDGNSTDIYGKYPKKKQNIIITNEQNGRLKIYANYIFFS